MDERNLGERKHVNPTGSRKHMMILVGDKKDDASVDALPDASEDFDLYYDGIELHSEKSSNCIHVWAIDNNIDDTPELFSEYGNNFAELMEHAMNTLNDYSGRISRLFRGIEKMNGMLAQSFLDGGISMSPEDSEYMERQRREDGSYDCLENMFDEIFSDLESQ